MYEKEGWRLFLEMRKKYCTTFAGVVRMMISHATRRIYFDAKLLIKIQLDNEKQLF